MVMLKTIDERAQYTANTGMATISTANSNLNGTGTLGTVLTAGGNGTLVKTVTIKAQGNTTSGMVRLFVVGSDTRLVAEIEVPAVTKSSTDPSFEAFIPTNFALQTGDVLKASTENAETFNVFAEGLDWAYYATSVRPESTQYTANTGKGSVSTANSNLDGSGTLGTILTATATGKGTFIQTVKVKSTVNVTAGMVRLFIYNGTTNFLLSEVPVLAITKSGTAASFGTELTLDLAIRNNYILKASTQNAENFNVIAEGVDWAYPA